MSVTVNSLRSQFERIDECVAAFFHLHFFSIYFQCVVLTTYHIRDSHGKCSRYSLLRTSAHTNVTCVGAFIVHHERMGLALNAVV
jgi:hypothetical protein